MREVVLDTETTGLEPAEGHRIVEIGALELMNQVPTGRTFHSYLNPDRPMPPEAFAIHGLGDDFLRDKPRFAEIAADLLEFLGEARLVIHNAAFDMRFLNAELAAAGHPALPGHRAFDTVQLARRRFPGAPASLDALCRRFGVDNSARDKHGALLDAELLAEVYLELIGGRQPGLLLPDRAVAGPTVAGAAPAGPADAPRQRPAPIPPRLTAAEAEAHAAFVERLGETAIWKRRAPG